MIAILAGVVLAVAEEAASVQRAELARAKASVLARHAEGHVTIGAWR